MVALSDQLEARLDQDGKTHTEVQRLRTIPGVGPRTAEAVVALARKRLVRCWALLRDQTVWKADLAAAPPQEASAA